MPTRSEREGQFHPNHKMIYADRSFEAGIQGGYITPEDERIIREYVREAGVIRQLSPGRQLKLTYTLVRWRLFLPSPYLQATYDDILKGVEGLKNGSNHDGKPFKQNTRHDYLRILKTFLLWLIENGHSTLPEKKILGIKVPSVDYNTTEPGDILTLDEILQLLKACRQPRDRAMVSCLYESGARIGELGRLQWRDLQTDEYGIKMYIRDQKGEQRRYARLVNLAPPYLAQWKEQYREETGDEPDGDKPVFLTAQNRPIEYQTIKALLERLTKRAGIKKRIHAHLFRKSRITNMIAEGFQESIVKEIMWKNPNTTMFRTYLKLSEKDIDSEILDKEGIKKKDQIKEEKPKEIICPNCFKSNGVTNQFCFRCGTGLTKEASIERSKLMGELEAKADVLTTIDPALLKILSDPKKVKQLNQLSLALLQIK